MATKFVFLRTLSLFVSFTASHVPPPPPSIALPLSPLSPPSHAALPPQPSIHQPLGFPLKIAPSRNVVVPCDLGQNSIPYRFDLNALPCDHDLGFERYDLNVVPLGFRQPHATFSDFDLNVVPDACDQGFNPYHVLTDDFDLNEAPDDSDLNEAPAQFDLNEAPDDFDLNEALAHFDLNELPHHDLCTF